MGDGKAQNVIEYLDYLVSKGKATSGAITPLKTAFSKVLLTVEGEKWGEINVDSVDMDDYMNRFANLTLGKYNSQSLVAYKSRANKAVTWYEHFLKTPGWTPDISRRAPRSSKKHTQPAKTATLSGGPAQSIVVSSPNTENIPRREHFTTYPFPLINGQMAQLSLPTRFPKKEAGRLVNFINSLAIDDEQTEAHDE